MELFIYFLTSNQSHKGFFMGQIILRFDRPEKCLFKKSSSFLFNNLLGNKLRPIFFCL
jgi:hypothetical protein